MVSPPSYPVILTKPGLGVCASWTARHGQAFIAAGVLLCPLFVLLMACVIGWSLFRKLWVRSRGSAAVEA